MKKSLFFIVNLFFISLLFYSQSEISNKNHLVLAPKDLIITQEFNSENQCIGYNLFIRKKDGMESVMLLETVKDPKGKLDNYAYRAKEWNKINGDEIRYLDGKELKSEYSKYSLISSSPKNHPVFKTAFHIFIPLELEYGYPWSRHGSVKIGKGVFINIRSFEKKYGDYTGAFLDNSYMFDFSSVEKKFELTDVYNPMAAEDFSLIAQESKGLLTFSKGPETITEDLLKTIESIEPKNKLDIVFAIDTTGSMKDDMETLQKEWIAKLLVQIEKFDDYRLGLVFFRDYNDNYNYKGLPVKFFDFTSDMKLFRKNCNSAVIKGIEGGDIPEALYEALYAGLSFYNWRSDAAKKIVLIGDAQAHPKPRGPKKISQEKVLNLAKEKNIILDCIILPDDKDYSSR